MQHIPNIVLYQRDPEFSEREIEKATRLDRKTIRLIRRRNEAVKPSTLQKIIKFLDTQTEKHKVQEDEFVSTQTIQNGDIVYSEADKSGRT